MSGVTLLLMDWLKCPHLFVHPQRVSISLLRNVLPVRSIDLIFFILADMRHCARNVLIRICGVQVDEFVLYVGSSFTFLTCWLWCTEHGTHSENQASTEREHWCTVMHSVTIQGFKIMWALVHSYARCDNPAIQKVEFVSLSFPFICLWNYLLTISSTEHCCLLSACTEHGTH